MLVPTHDGMRLRGSLGWLVAITSVAVFSAAAANEQPPGVCPNASCIAAQQETNDRELYYAIGDQVKVTFSDPVGAVHNEHSASRFESSEQSGTYVIQADGRVYLPIVGAVEIADRSAGEAHELLSAAFKAATGRTGSIAIVLGEREPVYLTGAERKPEAVKYRPGMTVLRAIALSGGSAVGSEDYARKAEGMRESERKDLGVQRLKRSLARRLVLLAERDGRSPPEPDEELLKLANNAEAEELIAANVSERRMLASWRDLQRKSLEQTIFSTSRDLERARQRDVDLEAVLKSRQEKVDSLSSAQSRGTLAPTSLAQARAELFQVKDRQEASKELIAQLDQRLFQAQSDQEKLALEKKIELARELKTVESDVSELEISVHAATLLAARSDQFAMQPSQAHFEIVRRTSQGIQKIPADPGTLLRPGDLLNTIPSATGAIP